MGLSSFTDPGIDFTVVTPSDTATLRRFRRIYVGGTGNIAIRLVDGTVKVWPEIHAPDGAVIDQQGIGIMQTNTTATNLLVQH